MKGCVIKGCPVLNRNAVCYKRMPCVIKGHYVLQRDVVL